MNYYSDIEVPKSIPKIFSRKVLVANVGNKIYTDQTELSRPNPSDEGYIDLKCRHWQVSCTHCREK